MTILVMKLHKDSLLYTTYADKRIVYKTVQTVLHICKSDICESMSVTEQNVFMPLCR
jgi:hypothetical protein